MINIICDGVWCRECGKYHPTLMWHKKYGYRDTVEGKREQFRELVENHPGMLGLPLDGTADEAQKEQVVELLMKNNVDRNKSEAEESSCVICGSKTAFISKVTGRHICSDECLYRENGWGEDCTGLDFDGLDPDSVKEYKELCRERSWPDL